MGTDWSKADKDVAKAAAERARRRADEEVVALHARHKVGNVDDLWALELHIRRWRKERAGCGTLNFQTADRDFARWLDRGWLRPSDLERLSPERLASIAAQPRSKS